MKVDFGLFIEFLTSASVVVLLIALGVYWVAAVQIGTIVLMLWVFFNIAMAARALRGKRCRFLDAEMEISRHRIGFVNKDDRD